jgi:prepilin-type N-terminal cleavage/methylation domain-containing protein
MMNSRGFTIVELIVVLTIITILTTLASLVWSRMSAKTAIEGQIKAVHADMMRIRLEALYGKRERRVAFSGKVFNVYSSDIQTTAPLESRTFKYNFTTDTFVFTTSGLVSGIGGSVCVDPYIDFTKGNDAYVDSLVVSDGRISLGKRTGAGCISDDITKR